MGAKVWELPDWKGGMTLRQLRSVEPKVERWGWFWVGGHSLQDPGLGRNHHGDLMVDAATDILRHAGNRHLGPLNGSPGLVMWEEDKASGNRLALYVPPVAYDRIPLLDYEGDHVWVGRILEEPPACAIIPEVTR